jgi:hypothetical protein
MAPVRVSATSEESSRACFGNQLVCEALLFLQIRAIRRIAMQQVAPLGQHGLAQGIVGSRPQRIFLGHPFLLLPA